MENERLLSSIDYEQIATSVAEKVKVWLKPMLETTTTASVQPLPATASRDEMAKILHWSLATLDRRTASGRIPSILEGSKRLYIVADVLAALEKDDFASGKGAAALESNEKSRRLLDYMEKQESKAATKQATTETEE